MVCAGLFLGVLTDSVLFLFLFFVFCFGLVLVLCSYDVGHVLREDTARRLRSEYKRAYLILSGGCKVTGVGALNLLLEEYIDVNALEEEKKKEEAANKEIEGKEEETKVLQKNSQAQKLKL
jgi:hypothetical protein